MYNTNKFYYFYFHYYHNINGFYYNIIFFITIFIYAFGHIHFKQRFQKRRMAELVIRDSNTLTNRK